MFISPEAPCLMFAIVKAPKKLVAVRGEREGYVVAGRPARYRSGSHQNVDDTAAGRVGVVNKANPNQLLRCVARGRVDRLHLSGECEISHLRFPKRKGPAQLRASPSGGYCLVYLTCFHV